MNEISKTGIHALNLWFENWNQLTEINKSPIKSINSGIDKKQPQNNSYIRINKLFWFAYVHS